MYNGGGGGSRPPTGQGPGPEMRYANAASPRPPTGAARPYTPGNYQDAYAAGAAPYARPSTQGSQIPPSTSHSNIQGYELQDPGRRPSMPTPVYDRPSYSRGNSPAPYAGGYNESRDDFHGQNYASEETYPLTAYAQHPMTPGTPYEGFEGDTGNAGADYYSHRPQYYQNPNVADDGYGPNTSYTPYDEGPNVRRGEPPPRQPRRFKTLKRVELFQGNLVLDCPVPPRFLNTLPNKKDREFTHMRYTAATCDPADFKKEQFTLRQVLYEQPRATEMFIVITLYNEDEVLFARTMHGVMKNISHLCSRSRSKVWGKEGWRKVVVCVVADGRTKINTRTLAMLAAMGVYQDGVAKNAVNGKPVAAHIFEYTTQISIDPSLQFRGAEKGIMPCQMIFCLKEKNQKKINSHRWFFQAFGPILQPNICILLDGGTRPGSESLYHLWKAFDLNSNIAGACGEIVAMKGPFGRNLLNPLVAAQNFEYKMSNILDKPLESVFGFISVLPGAFSAYRYIALQNDHLGQGPLASYFKGEKLHGAGAGIFEANMYLAEDRILCFELVAKRKASWVLHYVKSAFAETDVPDNLAELISQRRRWLNGSFFAAVYAISHAFAVFRTDHSLLRKLLFQFEFLYQTISMIFSWFALGNFFLIFVILTSSMGNADAAFAPGQILFMVFEYIYIALLVMCFVLYISLPEVSNFRSMGNRPQGSKFAYTAAAVFFALLMGYMLFCSVWLTIKGIEATLRTLNAEGQHFGESASATISAIFGNRIFRDLIVSTASTYGLYLFSSIFFFDFLHMFTSFIQYLLLSPSYVNILYNSICSESNNSNVYAFCNTHDVSWGTKGDNTMKTDLGIVKVGTDNKVEVDVPSKDEDIDHEYDRVLKILAKPRPEEKQKRDEQTKQEDYYKSFRTRVVLIWLISNLALIVGILHSNSGLQGISVEGSETTANIYLEVILWAVAALAAFRFIGAVLYLIFRLFQGE